jgi:hypothetical protein
LAAGGARVDARGATVEVRKEKSPVVGNRLLRTATLSLVASVLLYVGACASDAGDPQPEGEALDLTGVVYLGATNDEGLEVLLGTRLSAASVPRITAPADGATLEETGTFTFEPGATARFERSKPARFGFAIGELFGPERLAHAHGDPMNGEAYLLTFSTPADPHLLRVFTDLRIYEPDEAAWDTLAAAGAVTLSVRMGVFEEGRLSNGAGPFESAPLHFSISGP